MKPLSLWPAAACGWMMLVHVGFAHADTPPGAVLDPVVVTGTRTDQALGAALTDLRVVDSETLRASGSQSLIEVLQSQAGVEITSTGGPGQIAGVFLRGTNSNHVVVLVDGVRLDSATSGTTALQNIPVDQIDHIEVQRGPASSLYGADALGGVIQIFTRNGSRNTLSLGLGSWRTREASVGVGRDLGDTRWSVQAGSMATDGFPAANAQAPVWVYNPAKVDDPYRNTHVSASLSHDWAAGQTITARGFRADSTVHYDTGPGLDDSSAEQLSSVSLESRNRVSATWTSRLVLARSEDRNRFIGSFPDLFDTRQDQASWQNDLSVPGGTLTAGLEWRRQSVQSQSTAYSVTQRQIRSVFAEYVGGFGMQSVEASVRQDDNTQFGVRHTGRLAYGLRVDPHWRWSASAGTAFRVPTFNDLYYPSMFGYAGNPNLLPESSRSFETSLHFDRGDWRAGLTLFQAAIDHLIATAADYSTVINVNRARIRGATLTTDYRSGDYRAHVEFTRENPVDANTGLLLSRRAKAFGSAGATRESGPWQIGADIVGSGFRFDTADNAPSSRLGGYTLLNLRLRYEFSQTLALTARLDNATDKTYALAQGYNTPGRHAFVGLNIRMD